MSAIAHFTAPVHKKGSGHLGASNGLLGFRSTLAKSAFCVGLGSASLLCSHAQHCPMQPTDCSIRAIAAESDCTWPVLGVHVCTHFGFQDVLRTKFRSVTGQHGPVPGSRQGLMQHFEMPLLQHLADRLSVGTAQNDYAQCQPDLQCIYLPSSCRRSG